MDLHRRSITVSLDGLCHRRGGCTDSDSDSGRFNKAVQMWGALQNGTLHSVTYCTAEGAGEKMERMEKRSPAVPNSVISCPPRWTSLTLQGLYVVSDLSFSLWDDISQVWKRWRTETIWWDTITESTFEWGQCGYFLNWTRIPVVNASFKKGLLGKIHQNLKAPPGT